MILTILTFFFNVIFPLLSTPYSLNYLSFNIILHLIVSSIGWLKIVWNHLVQVSIAQSQIIFQLWFLVAEGNRDTVGNSAYFTKLPLTSDSWVGPTQFMRLIHSINKESYCQQPSSERSRWHLSCSSVYRPLLEWIKSLSSLKLSVPFHKSPYLFFLGFLFFVF